MLTLKQSWVQLPWPFPNAEVQPAARADTCSLPDSLFLQLKQSPPSIAPSGHPCLPLLRPNSLVLPFISLKCPGSFNKTSSFISLKCPGTFNKTSLLFCRLLLRIPHYNFNIVVMDKHGMDKERYPFPATPAELFALIDNFPLRKEEMKLQAEIGQSCP